MVGRLVEQQRVRRAQQHARDGEPRALAARQHAHGLLDVVAREQEAAEDVADAPAPCGWARRRRASGRRSASDRAASPRPARSTASRPGAPRCACRCRALRRRTACASASTCRRRSGPMSAMRSPRSMCSVDAVEDAPRAVGLATRRADRGPCGRSSRTPGNVKWTRLRSGGISIGTILSSILIRLCTCAALVAW